MGSKPALAHLPQPRSLFENRKENLRSLEVSPSQPGIPATKQATGNVHPSMAVIFLLLTTLHAQDLPQPAIRTTVPLVLVPTTVVDTAGKPINGLEVLDQIGKIPISGAEGLD